MSSKDYAEAIEEGNRLLADKRDHPDDARVMAVVELAAYLEATESDSIRGYTRFLEAWPRSAYAARVNEQLAHATYRTVREASDPAALDHFREMFPRSPLIPEAQAVEEALNWEAARNTGTIEGWSTFLVRHPKASLVRSAKEMQAEVAWRALSGTPALDQLLEFLESYGSSRFAGEARERSDELAWVRATHDNTIKGWRAYAGAFPGSDRAEAALSKEVGLAWADALSKHDVATYRDFELRYPGAEQTALAEDREWDLYHYERSPWPGELQSSISRAHSMPDGSWRLFIDVRDANGQFVGGLHKEHFRVYDAGFEAQITEFAGMETNRPVDVVFVIDQSGSMLDELTAVKEGILRFSELMQLRSRDLRLGLVTFVEDVFTVNGAKPSRMAGLTSNPSTFQRWVESVKIQAGSEEDHYQAMDLASRLAFRPEAQRIVVVVSDEDPTERKRLRGASAVAKLLSDRDTTVYAISQPTTPFSTLATGTGGELFPLVGGSDFNTTMATVAEKISKQYRIVYRRPAEAPPVVDQLKVRLRVRSDYVWVPQGKGLAQRQTSPGTAVATGVVTNGGAKGRVWMLLAAGGLRCSDDGGVTWLACGNGLPSSPVVTLQVDSQDPTLVLALTADQTLWASTDAGDTFSLNDAGGAVSAIAPDPQAPGRWFAAVGAGLVQGSPAEGWSTAGLWNTSVGLRMLTTGVGGELLAMDANGALWQSVDQGTSFTPLPTAPWASPPTGMAFHPSRRGLVIAVGKEGAWRSADGGVTWRSVPLEAGTEAYAVLFDPTSRQLSLLLTSRGVLASDDLGRTWTPQGSGLDAYAGSPLRTGAVRSDGRFLLADTDQGTVLGMERLANREFVFSSLYFASGSAEPGPALLPHLDAIALTLRKDRRLQLRVEGHSDSDGSDEMNLTLSQRRAQWTCDYLRTGGVRDAQLSAFGAGESRPLGSNATAEGRARNRRVEMLLIAPNESIPAMVGMQ